MKLKVLSEEAGKTGAQWNASRPHGVAPIPGKFNNVMLGDVWFEAPGREEDPSVGVEIGGVRKTASGYVYNGLWFWRKKVHEKGEKIKKHGRVEGVVSQDRWYWYAKRRLPAKPGQKEGEIEEIYIGLDLIDPETGAKIYVPDPIKNPEDFKPDTKQQEMSRD